MDGEGSNTTAEGSLDPLPSMPGKELDATRQVTQWKITVAYVFVTNRPL